MLPLCKCNIFLCLPLFSSFFPLLTNHFFHFHFFSATYKHETGLFVQYIDGKGYDFIHYNPNKNRHCNVLLHLIKQLNPFRVRGYNTVGNNPHGICAFLTWMEFVRVYMNVENTPFDFRDVRLIDYDHTKRIFPAPENLE